MIELDAKSTYHDLVRSLQDTEDNIGKAVHDALYPRDYHCGQIKHTRNPKCRYSCCAHHVWRGEPECLVCEKPCNGVEQLPEVMR